MTGQRGIDDGWGGGSAAPSTHGDVPLTRRVAVVSISLVTHRAGTVLAPHSHARATATVVLGGDFTEEVTRDARTLAPMAVTTKPAGAVHANRIGVRGARSLLLEVDEDGLDRLGGAARLFDAPRFLDVPATATVVIALVAELRRTDDFTPLTAECLVMEWFALAERERGAGGARRPPPWVSRVRDRIHATPVAALRLAELAADAGHHATYVARTFRRCYGLSIGEYARRLRVARAARALALAPESSLSRIALDAGYYDHSHLAHDFRARTRTCPSGWRRITGSGGLDV